MLSRAALQALRRPAPLASSSRLVAPVSAIPAALPLALPRRWNSDIATPTPTDPSSSSAVADAMLLRPVKGNDEGAIIKRFRGKGFPCIPGLRHLALPFHPHLYQGDPIRDLTLARRRKGGRGNTGQVVNRGVGGGHKQRIRIVDFYRHEAGVHDVVRIEYDPGRSGHIALLHRRGAGKGPRAPADEGARLAEQTSELPGGGAAARIARNEVKGGWSYILAPDGLRAGDTVESFRSGVPKGLIEGWESALKEAAGQMTAAELLDSTATRALGALRTHAIKPGNTLPLSLIPPGTLIHNISLSPDGRMQLCRSAGTFGQVVAHHDVEGQALGGAQVLNMGHMLNPDGTRTPAAGDVLVKLQSGEVRRLQPGCVATVGIVSNKEHQQRKIGKAGRNRWLGKRPKVRGVAMNTCDHPHGGGRGKSKGNKHPRSAKGVLQGYRTRRPKDKDGNKAVVTERPRGRHSK